MRVAHVAPSASVTWLMLQRMRRAAVFGRDRATPVVSQFKVGTALLTESGRIFRGGNMEVVRSGHSIHGEESALTNMHQGKSGEMVAAVLTVGPSGDPLAACGNCREALAEYGTKDVGVIMEYPRDRKVNLVSLADLLPREFGNAQSMDGLDREDQDLIRLATAALGKSYSPYIKWATSAAIRFQDGSQLDLAAVNRDDAAYHHEHAAEVALAISNSVGKRMISKIAIVAERFRREFCSPVPCGRCAQKLYEASEIAGVDIELLMTDVNGNVVVRKISELLPRPFGPVALGVDISKYRT